MQNSERFEELGFKLSVVFGFDVFAIEPNFVSGNVASRLNAFIVSLLLKLLSMMEVLLANRHQIS